MFGISNMFIFWSLAIVFISSFTELVHGGEFLYIPYAGNRRPNNTQAREVCMSYGTCELAVIDTQSEYNRMYQYFIDTLGADFILPTAVWIGLYWIDVKGNGKYVHFWEKSGKMVKLTWSYWDIGEPNLPGIENCGRLHVNMYIRSIHCNLRYDVLCEGTGQSSCLSSTTSETVTENVTALETATGVTENVIKEETGNSTENVTEKALETTTTSVTENVTKEDVSQKAMENTIKNGTEDEIKNKNDKHKIYTGNWWTPLRVGLISGFSSLLAFVIMCYVGWKCFCTPKFKVGCEKKNEIFKLENDKCSDCVYGYDEITKEESKNVSNNEFEGENDGNGDKTETGINNGFEHNRQDDIDDNDNEQDIDQNEQEDNESRSYVYSDDEDHHVEDKDDGYYVCDLEHLDEKDNEKENTEYSNNVFDEDEDNGDEENEDSNSMSMSAQDELQERDGDDDGYDNGSREIMKNQNIHMTSVEKTPPKLNVVNSAIPSKKYNSWMDSEDLEPDLPDKNGDTEN